MSKYKFENIEELNKKSPRENPRPSKEELSNLKVGDIVKVIFKLEIPTEQGFTGERMWVIIKNICNDVVTGELNNEPLYLKDIKCGDTIEFSLDNISNIWNNNIKNLDLDKLAILTKRAWENRQINFATKIDDLLSDKDSGWQLFYGDEDEMYLNEPNNTALVPLGAVLQFEPLLEKVFLSDFRAVTFSDNLQSFIELPQYF